MRFDDACVYFRTTKSHEDRFVPIDRDGGLLDELQRLKAMTMMDGGPFNCFAKNQNANDKWKRMIAKTWIPPVTMHDLRRTGISRALAAGMPVVPVMRLAGHHKIETTMRYDTQVSRDDMRKAVERLRTGDAS